MIKLLIGGSPCTYWSIAQKNNRETEPSGMGWELFKNYLISKEKFKPDFFLYENNKSAAQAIKDEIKKQFGVWDGTFLTEDTGARYIEINSALVSAQNRKRFYVHNCGEVGQPEDRGILLRDVLESGQSRQEKSYAVTTRESGAIPEDTLKRKRQTMVAEPVPVNDIDGKSCTIRATCYKDGIRNLVGNDIDKRTCVAEPIKLGEIGNGGQGNRIYSVEGKSVAQTAQGGGIGSNTGLYAIPKTIENALPKLCDKYGYIPEKFNAYNCAELTDKSPTLSTGSMQTSSCAVSIFEKTDKPVYEVRNGQITIKGKQFPIKLADGFYIIRKLTVTECCRLQTLPDDYCRAVSASQSYKGLGNGWTAEVIIHILNGALKDVPRDTPIQVLSMYDGIGTGRYCLDKMGFTNVEYHAYEIDKYAMQIAMSNYPDIIQHGDAFQVRDKNWKI